MKHSNMILVRLLVTIVTAVALSPVMARSATVMVSVAESCNCFSPSSVTIQAGDTVQWVWFNGGHNTASGSPCSPDGVWDSGIRPNGSTFSHTFNTVGSFPYFCTPHCTLGMTGTVIVTNASPTPMPSPSATATPTPPAVADGCFRNFTTAEGCDALKLLTTGAGNTALGWRSLVTNTTGSFNTGVGGGALALNNGDSNTAVGVAALLLNTSGTQNTAVGSDALVFNGSGASNTGVGYSALMNNTTGNSNTATGWEALIANTTGANNTAIGNQALQSSMTTSNHVAIGTMAGSGITTADNNIIIGHHSGVHSVFGQENDRCYIDNISGAPVSAATAAVVMVDSDGRLGTVTMDGPHSTGFLPKAIRPQAAPNATRQASLNRKINILQTIITQQQQQIKALTAQVNDQANQIQKASARLEITKARPRTALKDD